ncbi:MAG: MBL fold metallo-hydrolase [Clostridia bacterium]|nr:MBL fold metallo-hydrolase [Clostridia bacterium]
MARFITLCSSSGGNAAYIGYGNYGVLVDAGFSCRRLKTAMAETGVDPKSVRAIFLTHEHGDHIAGVRVLANQLNVPVYATGGTLSGLMKTEQFDGSYVTEKLTPDGVAVGDMHVGWFRTSHDAKESCGYVISLPDGRTVGTCTDTGVVTDDMLVALSGCDLVLLESNYDEDMLTHGFYPPQLKARIRSSFGHLSNDASAEAAVRLLNAGTRYFVLGHLSRENNTPALARGAAAFAFKKAGAKEGSDFALHVAPVERMDKPIVF